jgi:sulfur carrier protein
MIDIHVNGAPRRIPAAQTVAALVTELGLQDQGIALAVNRTVLPRHRWPVHTLVHRDRIDIVRAIGGG